MEWVRVGAWRNAGRGHAQLAVFLVAGLSLALSACGGGEGSTSGKSTLGHTPGSGSAQALRGAVDDFGSEAGSAQAQPIEAALHQYLVALVAGEWNQSCSYLADSVRHRKSVVARISRIRPHNCAGVVRIEAKAFHPNALVKAQPSSIRVREGNAYVIFDEAAAGVESAMGMRREGNDWRIVDSAPVPLSS